MLFENDLVCAHRVKLFKSAKSKGVLNYRGGRIPKHLFFPSWFYHWSMRIWEACCRGSNWIPDHEIMLSKSLKQEEVWAYTPRVHPLCAAELEPMMDAAIVRVFQRTEPMRYMGLYEEIYSKELAHMIMKTDKSQGLKGEPASPMSRRDDGIVLVQTLVDLRSGKSWHSVQVWKQEMPMFRGW